MTTEIQPKWQTMQDISILLGTPLHKPTRGSSVPQLFFTDIAAQMGIPQQNSMPALARAIVEHAHLSWSKDFSSEHTSSGGGSTVTALGLMQVKNAVLIWKGGIPIPLPANVEIENHQDWEPNIDWEEIRSKLTKSPKDVIERPGASEFRDLVLTEYQFTCAVSRCETESVIEVAHIVPYYGIESDNIQNAIPLRSDIHKLFDRGLLRIEFIADIDIYVSKVDTSIMTDYLEFDHQSLFVPENKNSQPSKKALEVKLATLITS